MMAEVTVEYWKAQVRELEKALQSCLQALVAFA